MLVTISTLSDWTGIERRTIRRRLSDTPPVETRGRAAYYDSTRVLGIIYQLGEGRLDPGQERALLDKARREAVNISIDKQAGDLIELSEVQAFVNDAGATLQRRLLDLPARLAAPLVTMSDTADIRRRLEVEFHELLNDLAARMAKAAKPRA